MSIETFVRTSGEVMGQVREAFGAGGGLPLAPPGVHGAAGEPQAEGQAADAAAQDSSHVHADVSALAQQDSQSSADLVAAATAAGAGRGRMDTVIAAAVADVTAMGMSTNTPQGRAALVAALKSHLEESKATLDGASEDAGTRAAAAHTNAAAYHAIAPPQPMAMLPQAASMMGSAVPGMAGMATMPAQMMSGMGGAMPMASLANLMHTPAPQASVDGMDQAGSPGAVLSSDHTVAGGAVRRALAQLGKPYVWGATGPSAFDCSGLVQYAYKGVGIDLPHHTYEQMSQGHQVAPAEAQAGDLVFSHFSGPGKPEHVQMALGDGRVVEAQQSGVPVKISSMPNGRVVVKRVVA